MNLEKIHSVYFIGIGGIGMSALARYFRHVNIPVAGYDKTESPLTKELTTLDIAIHYTDDVTLISDTFKNPETTLVVYTPAVPVTQSEYQYFLSNGFHIEKRSKVLGLITEPSVCLAVAGTHGKTTTSSILAHLMSEVDAPFTAFLGGISEDFNSNFFFKGTDYSVVEADEFDRSFLRLTPTIACITSMDADHLDIYGDAETLTQSFKDFANRLKPNGKLLVRNGLPMQGITYGINDNSDYCISDVVIENGVYKFNVKSPQGIIDNVVFNKPGKHNLLNALVAFAMAVEAGFNPSDLAAALATFKGVQRRFSYQIKTDGFVYIDDYAHHPTEIKAIHQAINELYPTKKVLVVFQPHLFSRTRDFMAEFVDSLGLFENVLLLDIYPAREEPIEGITSDLLAHKMNNKFKKVVDKANLIEEIKAQNPEIVVTMGAGDIGLLVSTLKNEFEYAY